MRYSITTEDWLEYAKEKSREEGKIEGIGIGEKRGISIGEKRGKAEGISIGEKRGIKREQIKVAKNMLKLNIDKNIISQVTGLTLEEINNL